MGFNEFLGYKRPDGLVGVRDHVAILSAVGCANEVAVRIARRVKGTVPILHHQGCCQLPPDLEVTHRTLVGLGKNPNVAAVLTVALGCEGISTDDLVGRIAESRKPVERIVIQDLGGTVKAVKKGVEIAREMTQCVTGSKREPVTVDNLILGIKCGASDATSGIAANPAVGMTADVIVKNGGTVIFCETTELIGAEHVLAKRAVNEEVAEQIYEIVSRIEEKAKSLGVDMRGGQPTPGNIEGGITTIEEKSLGAICKSGSAPIQGVLEYGERPSGEGLFIMDSPGREPEAVTGLASAGAQVIVFTTGRGAIQGFPFVPVIKVTGNPLTFRKLANDVDINAGTIIGGEESLDAVSARIYREILKVASSKKTKSEKLGHFMPVDIYRIGPTI